jgi:hypothetical protein
MSREPPSNSAYRPGSSMSISSMLGSDPDRPARDAASSSLFSRPPVTSSLGGAPSLSAPSAMSPPATTSRHSVEYPPFHRSQTPDKQFSTNQPVRPYRSSSGSVPQTSEHSRFGSLPRAPSSYHYPEKHHSTQPSPHVSPTETPYSEPRRLSLSGPIPRPNSQPQHVDPSPRMGYSPLSRQAGPREAPLGSAQPPPSYVGFDSQHSRFGGLYPDRHAEEQAYRDRERGIGHESDPKAPYQPRYVPHYGEREATGRHSSASTRELGRSQPPSPETKRFPQPEPGAGFGFGAIQSYTKSLGSQLTGSRQPPLSIQPRQGHQSSPPPNEQPYLSKLQTQPKLFATPSAPAAGPSPFGPPTGEEQRRKGNDELLHHRNLLGVGVDGKKGGRASPLPQAVQGAQGQILGPAGESGMKSDLGRVFSGIGSGVGGVNAAAAGSGPSTPMATSPFKRDSGAGRSATGETTEDVNNNRPGSATGKRQRRSRDEDGALEGEAGFEQRAGVSRAGRRGRHMHHHHHQYGIRTVDEVAATNLLSSHHHHRHKAEAELAHLGGTHRPLSSMNIFHRTSSPAEGNAVGHHHHHHHHHHHARPLASFGNASAISPMREPRTVVDVDPVVSRVAHLPRYHLGSTLYAPRVGMPNTKGSFESAKFGYKTTPQPLPRFEGRENCTFTVRVPRFRIDASHREELCARRAVWGTGVYTDDSDPVAAAVHAGFIRGAWGEDVDESMLGLEIKDTHHHAPQPAEGDEDRRPPVPPSDRDLHITLLILPKLERYESSVLFGIKSRVWDGSHDGMSFKVQRIDWVEEGAGRGEERGGEARRKRLRNLMQSGRICTGPSSVSLEQLRSGVEVPRRKTGMDRAERPAVQTVS